MKLSTSESELSPCLKALEPLLKQGNLKTAKPILDSILNTVPLDQVITTIPTLFSQCLSYYHLSMDDLYMALLENICNFPNRELKVSKLVKPRVSRTVKNPKSYTVEVTSTYKKESPKLERLLSATAEAFLKRYTALKNDTNVLSEPLLKVAAYVYDYSIKIMQEQEDYLSLCSFHEIMGLLYLKYFKYEKSILATEKGIAAVTSSKINAALRERNITRKNLFFSLYHNYGCALQAMGMYQEAAVKFEQAFSNQPNDLENILSLMNCYQHLYTNDKLLKLLNEITDSLLKDLVRWNHKIIVNQHLPTEELKNFLDWKTKNQLKISENSNLEITIKVLETNLRNSIKEKDQREDYDDSLFSIGLNTDTANILNNYIHEKNFEKASSIIAQLKTQHKNNYDCSPIILIQEIRLSLQFEQYYEVAELLIKAIKLVKDKYCNHLLECHFVLTEHFPSLGLKVAKEMERLALENTKGSPNPIIDYCLAQALANNNRNEEARSLLSKSSCNNLKGFFKYEIILIHNLILIVGLSTLDFNLLIESGRHLCVLLPKVSEWFILANYSTLVDGQVVVKVNAKDKEGVKAVTPLLFKNPKEAEDKLEEIEFIFTPAPRELIRLKALEPTPVKLIQKSESHSKTINIEKISSSESSEEEPDEILFTPREWSKAKKVESKESPQITKEEKQEVITIVPEMERQPEAVNKPKKEEANIVISAEKPNKEKVEVIVSTKIRGGKAIYCNPEYFAGCYVLEDYKAAWEEIVKEYNGDEGVIFKSINFWQLATLVHNFGKSPQVLMIDCWGPIKDYLLRSRFNSDHIKLVPLAQMIRVFEKLSSRDYEYERVFDKLSELTLQFFKYNKKDNWNPTSISMIVDNLSKARDVEKYRESFNYIQQFIIDHVDEFIFTHLVEIVHGFRHAWKWPDCNVLELYLSIAPKLQDYLTDLFPATLKGCITPYKALDLYKLTSGYMPAMRHESVSQDVKAILKPLIVQLYTLFQKISSQVDYTAFTTPWFYSKSKDLEHFINDDEIVTEYARENIKVEPSKFDVTKVLGSLKSHKGLKSGIATNYKIPVMDLNGKRIGEEYIDVFTLTSYLTNGQVKLAIFKIDPDKLTSWILNRIILDEEGNYWRIETKGGAPTKDGKFYGVPVQETRFDSDYSRLRSMLLPEKKCYSYDNKVDGYVPAEQVLMGKTNIAILPEDNDFYLMCGNTKLHLVSDNGFGYVKASILGPKIAKLVEKAPMFGSKKPGYISYQALQYYEPNKELVKELTKGSAKRFKDAGNNTSKRRYHTITGGVPEGELGIFVPVDNENVYLPNTEYKRDGKDFRRFQGCKDGGIIFARSPHLDEGNVQVKPKEEIMHGGDLTSEFLSNEMPMIQGGILICYRPKEGQKNSKNGKKNIEWAKFLLGVVPDKYWSKEGKYKNIGIVILASSIKLSILLKEAKLGFTAETFLYNAVAVMVIRKFYGVGSAVGLPKGIVEGLLHGDFDGDHGVFFSGSKYPNFYDTVKNTEVSISIAKPKKGYVSAIREDGQYEHSRADLMLSTLTGGILGTASTLLALYKRLNKDRQGEVATEIVNLFERWSGNNTPQQRFYRDILQEARQHNKYTPLEKGYDINIVIYIITKAIYIATDAPKATTDILKIGGLCKVLKQCFAKNGVQMKLPYGRMLLKDLESGNGFSEKQLKEYRSLLKKGYSLPDYIMARNLETCLSL